MNGSAQQTGEDGDRRPPIHGTNQSAMRAQNERLVLTLLRRHGALARSELARLTRLSAQTVSVIMRALESDGLIVRGEPRRGRVGQPSIPMNLSAEGAFFLGLKVGRRSMELVLVDFVGTVRGRRHETHGFPEPEGAVAFVRRAVPDLVHGLPPEHRTRIAGLGIGLPFQLWGWAESLGLPAETMRPWRDFDLHGRVASLVPYPVFLANDASAACNAEIVFGHRTGPDGLRDFAYAYIGYFAGGGLVLGRRLVTGRTGNAGALGSMPVPAAGGQSVQLLDTASLCGLETMLQARGLDPAAMWLSPENWTLDPAVLEVWCRQAARGLAHVAAGSAALLDLEALVIDGWMPAALRARLIAETARALSRLDLSGTTPPAILEGSIGPSARALGAAALPLSRRFLVDPDAAVSTG